MSALGPRPSMARTTITDERGRFLATTWRRTRSGPVVYSEDLTKTDWKSAPDCAKEAKWGALARPAGTGLRYRPACMSGNRTSSVEEAPWVVEEVQDVLGSWNDRNGEVRPPDGQRPWS